MSASEARGAALELADPAWRANKRSRRTGNRKITIRSRSAVVFVAEGIVRIARVAWALARRLALLVVVLACVGAVVFGGRTVILHVVASPHFAVQSIQISNNRQVSREEIEALTGVVPGDRLLALDPDAIAARVATHPFVKSAQVRRRLPSTLDVTVVEREARAVANLGGLYLVDEQGRAFKRATMAEAAGLVVLTGIERGLFVEKPRVAEAAFREALDVARVYQARTDRPGLSEIHLDPRYGFSLTLYENGAEIRLGRHNYGEKLARFDGILEALTQTSHVSPSPPLVPQPSPSPSRPAHAPAWQPGWAALRAVYLDGDGRRPVAMRLATAETPEGGRDAGRVHRAASSVNPLRRGDP